MFNFNKFFFKYFVYCPVVFVRGEWFFSYFDKLRASQYSEIETIENLQLEKLNKLISHARETVPFYKDLPSKGLSNLAEIQQLPFLEKDDLRTNSRNLCSSKKGLKPRFKTTGGSTGAAVSIRKSADGMAQELAATWRGYAWAGIDIGDKQARFWGVPHGGRARFRAKLIDFIANRKRLSAFSFSDVDLAKYVKSLEEFNPAYFYGYASMIRQFAEYVEKNNSSGRIRPRAVITTAEVLSEKDRETIERVFNCKVYNEYGCGEVGTIAHECKCGNLHVSSENLIVEVLNEKGENAKPGEIGEIVITDLSNYSMPLIRYRIKDFCKLESPDFICGCGVKLPVIKEIVGREYDYLVDSKDNKFHGEFFLYMVEDLLSLGHKVNGIQFVQKKDLSICVNIVTDSNFDFGDYFESRIQDLMGSDIVVGVKGVACIDRESSGKLRVVKRL